MKKFLSAVLALAMVLSLSVSSFAADSDSAEKGSSDVEGIVVSGTLSTLTSTEKTMADNMAAELRASGAATYVFDIDGNTAGDVNLSVPTPAGCTVGAVKYHNGQWVTVPVVSFGGGIVTVHMDGAFCPVVVAVYGGSATGTASTGTSPKTGLY